MAVEELESPLCRKRKRGYGRIKFIVNDRVEVRSTEDGFLGSWHPGTVIQCGKQKRHVRYDNILDEDGSTFLVDIVDVPDILDGESSTIYNERGHIRPAPPLKQFSNWDLPFGLCVDVNYEEAWWEGIIFDHNDGMKERSIFFPDLGDEMKVQIDHIRITHDWSEVTEEWERRGMWVFLELVEEVEQNSYVAVSVKQIWYDVRAKENFNKIKDWTCNVKELWRDLVLEVINDYFLLTMGEILKAIDLSKDDRLMEAPGRESGEPTADIHLNLERSSDKFPSVSNSDDRLTSKSNIPYDAVPNNAFVNCITLAENHLGKGDTSNFLDADQNSGNIIHIQEKYDLETLGERVSNTTAVADLHMSFPENEGLVQPESILPDIPEGISGQDCGTSGEVNYGAGSYKSNRQGGLSIRKRSTEWKPLILSEVELCPDSVHQYALASGRKIREQLKTDARKHIAYLGWKIEWKQHPNGYQPRQFRYTSPAIEGKKVVYMTLREVCQHIEKDTNMDSLLAKEDQRRTCSIDSNDSHPEILPLPDAEDIVERDYYPEAVLRYYLLPLESGHADVKRIVVPKARKHLLAEGWTFENPTIKGRGVIYISPQNQRFGSLRTACRKYIEEYLPKWISTGVIPLDVSRINEENTGLVDSDELSCCVSRLLQNEPELYNVNGAPASRLIGQCKPKRSKKLKSQDNQREMYSTSDSDISLPAILPPHSVEDVIEPEFCPEAVLRYYLYSLEKIPGDVKKCMILKARKHLLAEEWNLEYPTIKGRGMIYMSPQNVRFGSLRVACEAHIKECLPKWISSGMMPVDGLDINEEKMSQVDSDELASYVSQLLQKEPELSYLNEVPESRSTGHCKLKPSRNLKSRPPKIQKKRLPIRLQRSSKRVQKVCAPCSSNQKAQNVLSWLIDSNVLLPRSKVHYQARVIGRPMAEGRITRDGIKCSCCQKLYSIGGFGGHATGQRNCRSAAANILLENGKSLLDFQRQIMNEHRTRGTTKTPSRSGYLDENDGICSACQYGGELILCDNCPSSFHQSCMGLEDIPEGDWFCPACCCGICHQSKPEGSDDETLLTCSQCEHKYHAKCLGKSSVSMSGRCLKNWFCGKSCEKIHAGLHKLLGEPIAVGVHNLNWTLLKCADYETCDVGNGRNDLEVESYSKLNVALSVMHECFEPLKESYSGRDVVEDVIFSRRSKLHRLNFQGFYTVLLERNEEVVTVATVRIYGDKVAELPLVGTRFQYRRLGMCRILMDELEKRLMQLGVERIVLPAVPSVVDTWVNSFGFSKMTNSERSQFLDCTFLDFQDTVMCQKLLTKNRPALVLPTESHTKPPEVLPVSGGTGFDHQSSLVSEVYQEGDIDRNETTDLQIVDASAGNDGNLGNDAPTPVNMVKPANSKAEQSQNGNIPECSFEDGHRLKHDSTSNAAQYKYYERRKTSMKR
ncbi:hypothetical protein QN277_018279 [Acacia crassicarpa]|uniref:Uncharacterized protein n=1 Tax=Acacia crassicarpa TaxID=499986 RepID=A0AAE1JU57_9FABA|nr:hypothetical protein QN277_018279 [Acacia crassicarpa]